VRNVEYNKYIKGLGSSSSNKVLLSNHNTSYLSGNISENNLI